MSILSMPGAGKVSVDIHVEVVRSVGTVGEALVAGVGKVAADPFDGLLVEAGRMSGEPCTVVHGHADVWTGHLCQEVELANYGTIVPRLFSLVTVVVGMEDMNRWGGFGMRGGKAQVI